MRNPIGALQAGSEITICSGNQFQGGGGASNQLQEGSALFFRRAAAAAWSFVPMLFFRELGNNKYYTAKLAPNTFQTDDVVEYYLRIPYSDRDTTFVHANGNGSAINASEAVARNAPFRFIIGKQAELGQWGPVFNTPNVAIHSHLLPNGRVLMWGRRNTANDSLDQLECKPFVWDPAHGPGSPGSAFVDTPQPRAANGALVNLFCSGHAFLPDGRLLVVGGHQADGDGISQTALYDCNSNQWTATAPMTTPAGQEVRRWYPTAVTLPNGSVLVLSGSYIDTTPAKPTIVVDLLQVWDNGAWATIDKNDGTPLNFIGLPLYPRMHVASDGQVFMSGTNDRTLLLKTAEPGEWKEVAFRAQGNRDYCPAVMYEPNKVLYVGGGNEVGSHAPTAEAEIIDLNAAAPSWQPTGAMHFPRRQHNATVLPDGTVLVTGGTRGGGGPNAGFNDLGPGQPVTFAELWDPATGKWTQLAAEDLPRCYHATALLLPDGRVLSAGGGEYRPDNQNPNPPEDTQRNAQIFSPPYLFKGPRPTISSAPMAVTYGQTFSISTPQATQIRKVTWLAPGSVTHSLDENQRCLFLQFTTTAAGLDVTAPASANGCPPGYYLLFVVDQAGVPSEAKIVQVRPQVLPATVAPGRPARTALRAGTRSDRPSAYLQVYTRAKEVAQTANGTHVLMGITGTCPYGIGACWGGAYEALRRLEAVAVVGPIPNTDDSTAEVVLVDDRLPPLELWQQQFRRVANGSYQLRGVEVTLDGMLQHRDGELFLARRQQPDLRLAGLQAASKLQWDHTARLRKALLADEVEAHGRLYAHAQRPDRPSGVRVTGPLELSERGYVLQVRQFMLGV